MLKKGVEKTLSAAVIYPSLAPYHVSRIARSKGFLKTHNIDLHTVEIASFQKDYAWNTAQSDIRKTLSITTLFPQTEYLSLNTQTIEYALNSTLHRLKPSVLTVNGWGLKESAASLGYALKNNIPRILMGDSQHSDKPRPTLKELYKIWFVNQFQAYFTAGNIHVEYLQKLGADPTRCFIGCDVVDNAFFYRPSSPHTASHLDLFSSLRLVPEKNIIPTLQTLKKCDLPWTWTIAGHGSLYPSISQTISALGLEQKVTLLGHVAYEKIPDFFHQHAVYFQPSLTEPWGLAVNEAMACGKPVLASLQCGCSEELITHGHNGWLFNARKPQSLLDNLTLAWNMKDTWHQMGEKSYQAIQPWSVDMFAEQFKQCINKALCRPSPDITSDTLSYALHSLTKHARNSVLFPSNLAPNQP